MIIEIAAIAMQLLEQVKQFHEKRIVIKYLAPQYIEVFKGFDRGIP